MSELTGITIRELNQADLPRLEAELDYGDKDKHSRRLKLVAKDQATYLVAEGSKFVGHLLIEWFGATDPAIADNVKDCPNLKDIYVVPELRSQGLGAKVIEAAEALAGSRRYPRVGLGVDRENTRARELYERLGYKGTPYVSHNDRQITTQDGKEFRLIEDCTYMVKELQ